MFFAFAGKGAIECEVKFRIDSHTIKMASIKLIQLFSATR